MLNLRGKWVLITGASRGIGRLAALEMAKQGCHLILHSRERQHCDALLAKVQEMGVQAYAVQAELSDLEAVEKMLSEIDNKGTQVDVILNNAGLQIAYRTEYLKTPFSDYDISFKVNTIAPMMLPGIEPMPPSMIMHRMRMDSSNVNSVESIKRVLWE